jgi:hypothetical protein
MQIVDFASRCKRPAHGDADQIISQPEVGTIDIELRTDGWRVHHMDYDGDHGSLIDSRLPSRPAAIHAALTYALAILAAPGGGGAAA